MVPSSVAGRFTVTPSVAGCDLDAAFSRSAAAGCRITWLSGDSAFVLQHGTAILSPDTQYTFTLRGGFRDPAGAVNTVDHSWFITVAGAPEVHAVNPPDAATAVPVDQPITIDFNTGMNALTTERAISLDPAPPGTRVIPNVKDKSRFMLVPGALLAPAVTYRVNVSRTATDEHGQRLAVAMSSSFSTGALSAGGHAVVLARTVGQAPTRVILTALAAVEDGLPIAGETVLTAPTCDTPAGCGVAAPGAPLYTFSTAILSPDNRWLAVVEQDRTAPGFPSSLVVIDAASLAVRGTIAGGTLPSWSPDGTVLAFASAAGVLLYHPGLGTLQRLPAGDPIVAPPVWSPLGEVLALEEASATGVHIELADAAVGARFAVPSLSGEASAPAITPDGGLLAVYRLGGRDVGTWLVGIGANRSPARRLDPSLVPLGFAAGGTLIAVSTARPGSPSIVRVSTTGDVQIPLPQPPGSFPFPLVVVSPTGRQVAYLAAPHGPTNAFVANADGSDPVALTAFAPGTMEAAAVTVNG